MRRQTRLNFKIFKMWQSTRPWGYGAYVSGGTVARVYTVATPWPDERLFSLNYAQSNDVITFVHSKYPVYDVTRTDHNA